VPPDPDLPSIDELIPRRATEIVIRALGDARGVAIVGPRQVGKSTLARDLLPSALGGTYASLDDPAARASASADPVGFLAALGVPAVIDEVQRVPDLMLAIKQRLDEDRRRGQYVLTGSANLSALRDVRDALPGRLEYVQLWPLTQGELGRRPQTFLRELRSGRVPVVEDAEIGLGSYADRIVRGGFPEAVGRTAASRRRFFASYVDSVVSRDALDLRRIHEPDDLARALALVAARSAQLANLAAVGRELRRDEKTARAYLALLADLFLVRSHPVWSGNDASRLVKAPKVYVTDTGLLATLRGLDVDRLLADPALAGPVVETFVADELVRLASFDDDPPRFHHWRDRDGREIDVVLEWADGRIAAIEVKAGATPQARDFRALGLLRDRVGERFRNGVLLHTGSRTLPFGDRLSAVPIGGLWQ
jgi:uncharacterized protein